MGSVLNSQVSKKVWFLLLHILKIPAEVKTEAHWMLSHIPCHLHGQDKRLVTTTLTITWATIWLRSSATEAVSVETDVFVLTSILKITSLLGETHAGLDKLSGQRKENLLPEYMVTTM